MYQSKMSVLKHSKTLQHVSTIIQIIFRELVGSLLKSLNLKVFVSFFKIVEVICGNVWCVCRGVLWRLFVVMCGVCVERCAVEVICGNVWCLWRGVLWRLFVVMCGVWRGVLCRLFVVMCGV